MRERAVGGQDCIAVSFDREGGEARVIERPQRSLLFAIQIPRTCARDFFMIRGSLETVGCVYRGCGLADVKCRIVGRAFHRDQFVADVSKEGIFGFGRQTGRRAGFSRGHFRALRLRDSVTGIASWLLANCSEECFPRLFRGFRRVFLGDPRIHFRKLAGMQRPAGATILFGMESLRGAVAVIESAKRASIGLRRHGVVVEGVRFAERLQHQWVTREVVILRHVIMLDATVGATRASILDLITGRSGSIDIAFGKLAGQFRIGGISGPDGEPLECRQIMRALVAGGNETLRPMAIKKPADHCFPWRASLRRKIRCEESKLGKIPHGKHETREAGVGVHLCWCAWHGFVLGQANDVTQSTCHGAVHNLRILVIRVEWFIECIRPSESESERFLIDSAFEDPLGFRHRMEVVPAVFGFLRCQSRAPNLLADRATPVARRVEILLAQTKKESRPDSISLAECEGLGRIAFAPNFGIRIE